MTSLSEETGRRYSRDEVALAIRESFGKTFQTSFEEMILAPADRSRIDRAAGSMKEGAVA
jgi:hypothetical protein